MARKPSTKSRTVRDPAVPGGVLLSPHSVYFKLWGLARDRDLPWLRRQLFECGLATLFAARYSTVQKHLDCLLTFIGARGAMEGLTSHLLTCLRAAEANQDRIRIASTIGTLRQLSDSGLPNSTEIAIFGDRASGLISVLGPGSGRAVIEKLINDALGTSPGGKRGKGGLGGLIGESGEGAGPLALPGIGDGRNPIGRILNKLGAAMGGAYFPNGIPVGPGGVSFPPGTMLPFNTSDPVLVQTAVGLGGHIIGEGKEFLPGPGKPSVSGGGGTAPPGGGGGSGPSTGTGTGTPAGSTPYDGPPDVAEEETLDDVLGEPDPPLTPEEIDEMTGTPNPMDEDGNGGPKDPAGMQNPMDEDGDGGIRGPLGRGYHPAPDGGIGGPAGYFATPHPDGGGPMGPAALSALRTLLKGSRFYSRSGAIFFPVATRNVLPVESMATFVGFNREEKPTAATYLLRVPIPRLRLN